LDKIFGQVYRIRIGPHYSIKILDCIRIAKISDLFNNSGMYKTEVSMARIRIGYPAGYLRFLWIRIGFGYLFLKKIGSGQDQDIF